MGKSAIQDFEFKEVTSCGACRSKSLQISYDFGKVPLAGYFPKIGTPPIPLLPMKLLFCPQCTLFQISPNIPDDYLFRDYRYVSSIGMQSHFDDFAKWFEQNQKATPTSRILEIGCNDGPMLAALTKLGYSPVGIDPASNIVEIALSKGLRVINDFFGTETVKNNPEFQNIDYLISSNSFAHISDIYSIAEAVANALAPNGRFIVEVQSLVSLVETNSFDFIYHEHKYYYTLTSITNLLSQFGLNLIECMQVPSHGGSYRLVFGREIQCVSDSSLMLLNNELEMDLSSRQVSKSILKYFNELEKLDEYLFQLGSKKQRIIGFGASGRANMILGNLPKASKLIKNVVDESPERIGRMMAQNPISVVSLGDVEPAEYDAVVILAWNYEEKIMRKWGNRNCKFLIPLPEFRIIGNP